MLVIATSLAILSTASALYMALVYRVSADLCAGIDCDEVWIRSVDESWGRRVPLDGVPRGCPLNRHRGVRVSIQLLRME